MMTDNVKRTVPLDDDQYMRLKEVFNFEAAASELLTALLLKAAERRAEKLSGAWDTVDRLVDRKTGEKVSIDWINHCIVVNECARPNES